MQVTPPSAFANSDTDGMTRARVRRRAVSGNASDAMIVESITSTSPAHGSFSGTSTVEPAGSGDASIHFELTRKRPSGSALHARLEMQALANRDRGHAVAVRANDRRAAR